MRKKRQEIREKGKEGKRRQEKRKEEKGRGEERREEQRGEERGPGYRLFCAVLFIFCDFQR